ncbi:MAG: hypothetical protein ABI577_07045 [bacterium]
MFGRIRSLFARLTTVPKWPGPEANRKRQFVRNGAVLGLLVSLPARFWMRTISEHHVFTIPGTLIIIIVFSGMGALAGLAAWWRRNPQRPRGLFVRAVAFAPFALLGPFTLLFLPSVVAAAVTSHPGWKTWVRRIGIIAGVLAFAFTELILLTMDVAGGPAVRVISGVLYLPLAYVLFVSNRGAFDPLPPRLTAASAG